MLCLQLRAHCLFLKCLRQIIEWRNKKVSLHGIHFLRCDIVLWISTIPNIFTLRVSREIIGKWLLGIKIFKYEVCKFKNRWLGTWERQIANRHYQVVANSSWTEQTMHFLSFDSYLDLSVSTLTSMKVASPMLSHVIKFCIPSNCHLIFKIH